MKTNYCSKCNKKTEVKIINKDETFNVRGDNIKITSSVSICENCNEEVFDEVLDEQNLELAYTKYRKKHNLLSPVEIKNVREKYGLSQRALGKLLEWGEITINRYENGAVQDTAHNEILRLISSPETMKEIFEKNNYLLPSYIRITLKKRIDEMIREEAKPHFHDSLEKYLMVSKGVNEFSGYKIFSLNKLINMILYITKNGEYKTKINKLLWYIDFLHFKKYSVSISGGVYYHLQYGPILDDYELILGSMMKDNLLKKEEVSFKEDMVGENIKAEVEIDKSLFTESELAVMKYICKHFRNYNCTKIKDYSHNEQSYKNTFDNERISYELASTLSID